MKIGGHTVGSDGIVYDPDAGRHVYIGALDSRVENNHSDERGYLVTDQGRPLAIHRPGTAMVNPGNGGSGPASGYVTNGVGGNVAGAGGTGPGAPGVVTGGANSGGAGSGSLMVGIPEALIPKDTQLKRIGVGGQQESLGAISDLGWARTATGWVPVPSSDVKERIEDNLFMEGSWFVRNYLGPMFFGGEDVVGPDFLAPEYSHYIPGLNEWREGGSPRRNTDGQFVFTGGGF